MRVSPSAYVSVVTKFEANPFLEVLQYCDSLGTVCADDWKLLWVWGDEMVIGRCAVAGHRRPFAYSVVGGDVVAKQKAKPIKADPLFYFTSTWCRRWDSNPHTFKGGGF